MTKDNRIKVAAVDWVCGGYTLTSDCDAVEHFNTRVLPVLRELGLFKSRNIPDYYGMNRSRLFRFYKDKAVTDTGKSPLFKDDPTAVELERKFDALLDSLKASTHVKEISAQGLSYVSYDERAGRFVIDMDAYRDATMTIYANAPEEKRAFELLNAAAKAIDALRLDKLTSTTAELHSLTLGSFIEFKDGHAVVKSSMWPGPWHELVNRIGK